MQPLLIWGATGQAKVLHEALHDTDTQILALVDQRALVSPIFGIPVLVGGAGLDAWLAERAETGGLWFAVAIGGDRGADRLKVFEMLSLRGLQALTIVHRTAFVAHTATMGAGCQILAQAAICTGVQLGKCVIVNTAASVDHDCHIGDSVHLAPGARLAGEIEVGERAFIGTGAIVLPRLKIGADAVVGAGAVVTRDVPANAIVVGNPARILKYRS